MENIDTLPSHTMTRVEITEWPAKFRAVQSDDECRAVVEELVRILLDAHESFVLANLFAFDAALDIALIDEKSPLWGVDMGG